MKVGHLELRNEVPDMQRPMRFSQCRRRDRTTYCSARQSPSDQAITYQRGKQRTSVVPGRIVWFAGK